MTIVSLICCVNTWPLTWLRSVTTGTSGQVSRLDTAFTEGCGNHVVLKVILRGYILGLRFELDDHM